MEYRSVNRTMPRLHRFLEPQPFERRSLRIPHPSHPARVFGRAPCDSSADRGGQEVREPCLHRVEVPSTLNTNRFAATTEAFGNWRFTSSGDAQSARLASLYQARNESRAPAWRLQWRSMALRLKVRTGTSCTSTVTNQPGARSGPAEPVSRATNDSWATRVGTCPGGCSSRLFVHRSVQWVRAGQPRAAPVASERASGPRWQPPFLAIRLDPGIP